MHQTVGNFLQLLCSQFLNSPLFKVLLIFVLLVHRHRMEQVGLGVFIKCKEKHLKHEEEIFQFQNLVGHVEFQSVICFL
jgi:hypothetical protein